MRSENKEAWLLCMVGSGQESLRKGIRINGMSGGMLERETLHRLLLVVIFLLQVEGPYFVGGKNRVKKCGF